MARNEAAPFARGETYYNGGPIDTTNLGGTNLEGREYLLEPNAPDDPTMADPSGRCVKVKVVRNISGIALKPGRLVHYDVTTAAPYECRIDGYCFAVADRPAGIVDEFLPAAGVANNDLFYIVVDGPTQVTNTAAGVTFVTGDRLVPAATGSNLTDDLAGRVAKQDETGATATLGNNVQDLVGFAGLANAVANAKFTANVHVA